MSRNQLLLARTTACNYCLGTGLLELDGDPRQKCLDCGGERELCRLCRLRPSQCECTARQFAGDFTADEPSAQ